MKEIDFSGRSIPGGGDFESQRKREFPLKIYPIIVVILSWYFLLFLYEVIIDYWAIPNAGMVSPGDFATLAMLFGLSVGIGRSRVITSIFMKRGRNVGEIMPYLNLLSLVFGIMLVFIILSKIVSIL